MSKGARTGESSGERDSVGKVRGGPHPGIRAEELDVQNHLAPARDGGRRGEGITGTEGSAQSPTTVGHRAPRLEWGPACGHTQTLRAHTLLPILQRTPSAGRETPHSRTLAARWQS